MNAKIEYVESQFAQKLGEPLKQLLQEFSYSIPSHHKLRISLLDSNRRKKRSNAAADNWSPEFGRIEIRFEPVEGEASPETANSEKVAASTGQPEKDSEFLAVGPPIDPAEVDLIKALDRAESKPGWSFVPLKKFRDEMLVSENLPSMRSDIERQSALRASIDKKFVLVGKVPNPKAPQFPVTTVRLNRLRPEVQAILGGDTKPELDFRPVEIRGEPLSASILRERR